MGAQGLHENSECVSLAKWNDNKGNDIATIIFVIFTIKVHEIFILPQVLITLKCHYY